MNSTAISSAVVSVSKHFFHKIR